MKDFCNGHKTSSPLTRVSKFRSGTKGGREEKIFDVHDGGQGTASAGRTMWLDITRHVRRQ
ncbi:hypothetical protein Bpfe_025115, partial [Biomphalaria pfeifferi]